MAPRLDRWILLAATLILLAESSAAQTTRYVSKTGSHTSPYNTWARAATNVHAAVSGAAAGTTILVSNGVYALTGSVTLATTISLRSVNGPEVTELRGNDSFRLLSLSGGAGVSGLTLTDGAAAGSGSGGYGGGIYANNARISNCVIRSCSAASYGGGVYFFSNGGLLTHSILDDNSSTYGGGVHCRAVGVVSNCVFTGNRAAGSAGTGGGGAYLYQTGVVAGCTFRGNTAGNDGGGVLMDSGGQVDSSAFFDNIAGDWGGAAAVYFRGGLARNCLIVGNRADEGGGLYFHQSGLLENCTVVDNQSLQDGSGVKFSGGGTSVNSIIYHNLGDNYATSGTGPSFAYTCTTPALSGAADSGGNISDDPGFLHRPESVLHLLPGSPCIDSGTNLAWHAGSADLHGSPRVLAGRVDMGAYEFGPLVCHFYGDPVSGQHPLPVLFTALVTGSNLAALVYRWDTDNNGTFETNGALATTFAWTYTNGGQASVRLDTTNAAGERATLVRTNYVFTFLPHLVATNGGHIAPFLTWANAATSLEAAVAEAEAGGVVYVSNGVFATYGQVLVTQAMTIASVNGPATTVIRNAGASRVFRIRSGVTIAGFTIRDGVATGAAEQAYGGGVYLDGGGLVTNCILVSNRAAQFGGGAHLAYGGLVTHTLVASNRAQLGGGVACYQGGMVFDCTLTTNTALDRGGGAYVLGNSIIRNSILDRNAAVSNGGGAALISSGSTLQNCSVVSNRAANGGGIFCEDGGNVQNTIACHNTAAASFPNWQTNTAVYDYGAVFSSACLSPTNGLPNATGCFTNDPQFVPQGGSPYGLAALSPCVNRGAYSGWMNGTFDVLGTPRIVGGAPDVGALERVLLALAIVDPVSGQRLPFGATWATIRGTASGPVGQLAYTNRSPSGPVTGNIPVTSNWSFQVQLPRHGTHVISVSATDSVGNVALDSVTIFRNRNQVFIPAPP